MVQMAVFTQPALLMARLPCQVSVAALQADLARCLQLDWQAHVNQRDYQGGWDLLPLRCQRQHVQAHPLLQGFAIEQGDDWTDLPLLAQLPAFCALLAQLQCPLKAVRLMRLRSGAFIKPHRDQGLSLEHGQARLHLALQTDQAVQFLVAGRPMPCQSGELWYFNADAEHQVHNQSAQDRIHLVIDAQANDWLYRQVQAGSVV